MQKSLLIVFAVLISQFLFGQEWEQKTTPPNSFDSRHHPVTFAINGYGYVATGVNQAELYLSDFYRYEAATDSWEELPDFPGSARGYSYGIAVDDKAYMGFGLNNSGALRDLWEYDGTTETWSQLTSCPCTPRWHPAMVHAFGKIYVGLGSSSAGDRADWWAYDIATDTWTEKPDLPGPGRHHPYYFGINNKVYAGFGHSGQFIYSDFYVFNPNINSWAQLADFPGEGRVAGTQFDFDGKGYVLSGDGDDHGPMPTGEMWEYDPALDSWTSLPPHPGSSRWAPGSFVVDGTAYFVFGWIDGETFEDIWAYDLSPSVNTKDIITTNVTLFPNPTSTMLTIESDENFDRFEIFDVSGKLMRSENLNSNHINVAELDNGVYAIRFFSGEKTSRKQFSIVR